VRAWPVARGSRRDREERREYVKKKRKRKGKKKGTRVSIIAVPVVYDGHACASAYKCVRDETLRGL